MAVCLLFLANSGSNRHWNATDDDSDLSHDKCDVSKESNTDRVERCFQRPSGEAYPCVTRAVKRVGLKQQVNERPASDRRPDGVTV